MLLTYLVERFDKSGHVKTRIKKLKTKIAMLNF
ncbi:MAG: hypothetical protein FNNCIFGK_00585 [Bacteroidia bacterium]|nr:MAG: hypothetical protein UZ10_BCD003001441 [Bacteroidetes bacterium OLB10]MBV6453354.1 hypothetical protein [Bacteroidia bacterium]